MNRIIKGDKVRIISGKNKAKEGVVLNVDLKNKTAVVEGVNIVKIHKKPNKQKENDKGGIVSQEAPIKLCKLALVTNKGVSKVGFSMENGKKTRIYKKTGAAIMKGNSK